MKKSIWRKPFDPAAEYVVLKVLRFGGRTFKSGELFTPTTTARQKRLLFQARYLDFKPEDPKPAPVKPPPIGSPIEPPKRSSSEPSSTSARISMAGRGWYNVLDGDGKQINESKLRMKDAEELLKQAR